MAVICTYSGDSGDSGGTTVTFAREGKLGINRREERDGQRDWLGKEGMPHGKGVVWGK